MNENKKRRDCDKTRGRAKKVKLKNKIEVGKVQKSQNTEKMYRKIDIINWR